MTEALKPCRSCGYQVSKRAVDCPNCGRRMPAGGASGAMVLVTLVVGALVLWYVFRMYG